MGLIIARIGQKETSECRHIGALAGGLCRVLPRHLHLPPSRRGRSLTGPIPYLVENAHRNSPVRHGAIRIAPRDLLELPLRFLVPEIMQQGDAAYELSAHRRRT